MKKLHFYPQNTAGFTLVEMMVVVAIISIVSLSFAGYMYQQSRLSQGNDSRQNYSKLQNTVLHCAGSGNCLQQTENLQK